MEMLEHLGINTEDGVVRLSMTHYNTYHETKNVISALEKNLIYFIIFFIPIYKF